MSGNDIIVSLDIGTSKVRAIIGEVTGGSINIVGVGSADSEGIRKGAIVDIDQTVQSIKSAVDHSERMVGVTISEVFVGIAGNHIQLQSSHGVVAVSNEDREIGGEDIERVLQAAKVIALPPEREIIGIVPKQYIVDGLEGIHDPRGMIGVRLEVEAIVITGAKTAIHNLIRCVEKAELKVAGLILMPLAAGHLALSKDEKNLGTVLVDIGAGATTISIFENGTITATATLPIGGEYVSNDITIGLRTQLEIAEKIKLKYGCASIQDADPSTTFKVTRIGSNVEKEFSQADLASIVEPRMQEIFELIKAEVKRMKPGGELAGGYVLTGGAVSMPAVLSVAQSVLETSVRIASPDFIGVREPAYASGVGVIAYVAKFLRTRSTVSVKTSTGRKAAAANKPSLIERIKNLFSEFI
ncbi:cell division protein FtsA [Paenibacillus antri]|uniref:Cell division protein FtsA n=1 Tax=Paenibacillus antri TaxID=2582848 RepID=A0A5R9GG80_9BACL|nr:cell division protein FtsA [Paenibacillus antri]TLS50405.1 cell division protein FtsA [Paenibacillus antri]